MKGSTLSVSVLDESWSKRASGGLYYVPWVWSEIQVTLDLGL